MVKKNIKNTIEKHNLINAGEHIVIGLSGGPDSVCLFSVLNELKEEMQFTLHAVHVNHGFRPGAAEEDQLYVEQLCRENGVECTSFVFDCNAIAEAEGLSSEEAGRKVRYGSFLKAAQRLAESGIPMEKIKIAVAQNADDQAETVLFRLLRGTGTDGLAGMAYARMEKNIMVIRPLLDTWRCDIEKYCNEQHLVTRTDKTNLEPVYTRNKIRLQLIPYLQENFNPNIMDTLNRMSCIAGEDKEYLWQCAEDAYEELETAPGVLQQQGLAELAPSVRHRVIMKALQQQGMEQDITYSHLEAADRIMGAEGGSRTVEFPDGYRMSVRYGEAVFYRVSTAGTKEKTGAEINDGAEQGRSACLSVSVCQIEDFVSKKHMPGLEGAEKDSERCSCDSEKHQSASFDYDKVKDLHGDAQIVWRTRREGDFLSIKGGRKKIQNLFVDMKVPKEHRDQVMMAAVGSEILWIPVQLEKGVKRARYNNRCKLDIDTKKCLLLEINCVL